jgi:hypothetical protein
MIGVLLLFLMVYGGVCGAQDPKKAAPAPKTAPDSYTLWFVEYQKALTNTMPVLTDEDKALLQEALTMKPIGGSPTAYRLWLKDGLDWFIQSYGTMVTDQQFEKLSYIIAGIPDLNYTQGAFDAYMELVIREVSGFLPILDDSKRKYFEYFKMAQPKTHLQRDYQTWFLKMMQIKKHMESLSSDTQDEVIAFLQAIQPPQAVSGARVFQVSEETLLKIRNYLQNQQANNALQEVEAILTAP